MLANNLKIAWRHLVKDRFISTINLLGLVVGMTAFLFIWQYVAFERSYDDFHEKKERIFRVRTDRLNDGVPFMKFAAGAACAAPATVTLRAAPAMDKDFQNFVICFFLTLRYGTLDFPESSGNVLTYIPQIITQRIPV